ncbi:hypothetical protein [Aeromicrobium sp.]|uniref:hypothetical protein n=1 Tax=Aeromicrobium sp. TaxID=1871063 RepID=UPI002FC73867
MTMHKMGFYRGQSFTASFGSFRIPARWATEIDWLLTVEGVTGAPTTASLRVVPQIAAMHTRNQTEESRFASTQDPLWLSLNPTEHQGMLPDGAFGEVATEAIGAVNNDGSNSLVIPRRQLGGYWSRLWFDMAFTGGTTPGFQISLEAVLK